MTDPSRPVRDIQPAPSHRTPTKQAGPTWAKSVLAILAVVVLVISGFGYALVGRLGNEVASASNLGLGDGLESTPDGATDILLVGSDSRTDAQGNPLPEEELAQLNAGADNGGLENTDTIMVVRIPEDGSEASAVSIPRDTYVHDDEFGNLKINSVYATHKADERQEQLAEDETATEGDRDVEKAATEAGRQGLLSVVGELTGVDIDHYAEVGLHGFVSLTDAVGGVDVCLNEPVDDPLSGADFPAGEQTLNGHEALAFVRQRHGLPRGDLDRVVRQQAYMASLVNKILSTDVLTSPARLADMADAVENSVVIDEDWDVVSFATQLANIAGGDVLFTTIPVTSVDGVGDYGESIVTVNPDQVQSFMDDLVAPEEPAETAPAESPAEEAPALDPAIEGAGIHVLNAGSASGQANGVGDWLEERGATVELVSNAQPGIYTTSQVVAADPSDPAAVALAEELGGLPVTANAGLDSETLIVATANDYAGPANEVAAEPAPTETNTADEAVGTPGTDFGQTEDAPELDAGGDGPRCVN